MLNRRMANLAVAAVAATVGSIVAPVTASASALPQVTQQSPMQYAQAYGSTVAEAEANAYNTLLMFYDSCTSPVLVASGDAGNGTVWAEIRAMCAGGDS